MEKIFRWIFYYQRIETPEINLCRQALIQLMSEITWHKISVFDNTKGDTPSFVKYIRCEESVKFVKSPHTYPYSFLFLCDITGANHDLIREYVDLSPEFVLSLKFMKKFNFEIIRRFKKDKWIFDKCIELDIHNIDYRKMELTNE